MLQPANRLRYLFTLILLIAFASPAQAQFAGGDGTPENPYQIETFDQLNEVRNFLDANFILLFDIDNQVNWIPIGTEETPFTGSFDGNGKTIKDLFILDEDIGNNVGLFGKTSGATINNLTVTLSSIDGSSNVGVLVGFSDNGTTIDGCKVRTSSNKKGDVEGVDNVGALVGRNAGGSSITNSSAEIKSVYASGNNAGGLVGINSSSTISSSHSSVRTRALVSNAGGLVGTNQSSSITDSYATGKVLSLFRAGGLVGSLEGNSEKPSAVTGSYASGKVEAKDINTIGGVSGGALGLIIFVDSFWGTETTGANNAIGNDESGSINSKINTDGLTGLTQAEMQQQSSFIGFDFTSTWQINEGSSYPYLQENLPEEPPFVEIIPEFAGGDGSPGNPYQIEFGEQLDNIRDFPDAHFELIDDIELGTFPYDIGEGWEPVGTASGFPQVPFTGTIDGNGFTISNLFIESNSNYNSLLGDTENCTVTDLNFENASVSGIQFIGILASQSEGCTFENISVQDIGLNALPKAFNIEADSLKNRVSGTAFVGGLVGYSISSTFDNIFVEAFVENTGSSTGGIIGVMLTSSSVSNSASAGVVEGGNNNTGGLVGENLTSSLIRQSYSISHVTGGNLYVGGLVGNNSNSGRITNSYALGSVTGSQQVGGLVGRNNAEVDSSYSAGQVIGVSSVGGLVGSNNGQTNNSFWNVETAGIGISIAGTGFTDESFKTQDSLSSLIDFTGIWTIDEGTSFPYLQSNTPLTPPSLDIPQIFAGGSGSMSDPFQISTIDHLSSVRNFPDANFSLLNDISFNPATDFIDETGWVPIGSFEFPFTKGFEGNGHTISNLFIDRQFFNNQGLFGYVEGASITNLTLDNVDVIGSSNVGGLAGLLIDAIIENLIVHGSIIGSNDVGGLIGNQTNTAVNQAISTATVKGQSFVGGLIGTSMNSSSTMNSSSSADVNGLQYVGGLIGYNNASGISNSFSIAEVVGSSSYTGGLVGRNSGSVISETYYAGPGVKGNVFVGGLIGSNESGSTVSNSYSIGEVEGTFTVGGFIGESSSSELTNNYSAGLVTALDLFGGFAGEISGTTLENLFWNIETAGTDVSESAIGLSDSDFKMQSSFTGFDFGSVWAVDENSSYPYLINLQQNPAPVLDIPEFFAGGSGTEQDPFLIESPEHLNNVRRYMGSWYRQISDIDMNVIPFNIGEGFNPIGNLNLRFSGEYDGDDYAIKYLFINRPTQNYVGLFGFTDSASVTNVYLEEVNISGKDNTGALGGNVTRSTVDSSFSSGIVNGSTRVGGLIGLNEASQITRSSSSVNVTSSLSTAGGLVGYLFKPNLSVEEAIISESYSTGDVNGVDWVGGLVGLIPRGTISNSYSTSNVVGRNIVGGLVGDNNSSGVIENVYSSGSVSGDSNVGGLLALNTGTVTGGWWNTENSGQASSAAGTGLTEAEMKMEVSFPGFDFAEIWTVSESVTFPFLQENVQNPGPGIPVIVVEKVTLLSPSNVSSNVPTDLVLEWESASDAVTYHVQVATTSEFVVIISQDEDVSGLTYELNSLDYETTYFWRVRGENEFGFGEWSDSWFFTTTGIPPAQVMLLSPANLSEDVVVDPILEWGSVGSASTYSLQLSSTDDFTALIVDEPILSDTTYQVTNQNDKAKPSENGIRSSILQGLTTYYWRVRAVNEFGNGDWSNVWEFTTQMTVSNEDDIDQPTDISLAQNYPNPFNPSTTISFELPEAAEVRLLVYDLLGRNVATLVQDRVQAGTHNVNFNASSLASGVYIYQLITGNQVVTRKMMLIK